MGLRGDLLLASGGVEYEEALPATTKLMVLVFTDILDVVPEQTWRGSMARSPFLQNGYLEESVNIGTVRDGERASSARHFVNNARPA